VRGAKNRYFGSAAERPRAAILKSDNDSAFRSRRWSFLATTANDVRESQSRWRIELYFFSQLAPDQKIVSGLRALQHHRDITAEDAYFPFISAGDQKC